LTILSINQADRRGGAAEVAWNLLLGYLKYDKNARLLVAHKFSNHPQVFQVDNAPHYNVWTRIVRSLQGRFKMKFESSRGGWRILQVMDWLANPAAKFRDAYGIEEFNYPGFKAYFNSLKEKPDVLHLHNLHGGYFDLNLLPTLSSRCPVFLTLHDAWMISGHCAHSFECERWQSGCGSCPDLTIPRPIKYDNSALNWRRKSEIYSKSKLYISTPSAWLMNKVKTSILAQAGVEFKVIPNGVDQSLFFPDSESKARVSLGLESDAIVLLFSANGIRKNRWKDFELMRNAVKELGKLSWSKKIIFLALGEQAPTEIIGEVELRFEPFRTERNAVVDFYRAADIYIHAAKADTFPNSVIEALSCGTPVLATAVGGIPEQVKGYRIFMDKNSLNHFEADEATGLLCTSGDLEGFVDMLRYLIENESLRKVMRTNAVKDAQSRFSLQRQVATYTDWFESVTLKK
jgi:glycosyltransferase involved in cell wall biosynthesis